MKPFKNKTAFVTGASKGIGYACALRLAEGGANVFLSSSNEERLRKASQEINKKTGVKVGFHASDLRQLNGCIEATETLIDTFGGFDILINSAGATKGGYSLISLMRRW